MSRTLNPDEDHAQTPHDQLSSDVAQSGDTEPEPIGSGRERGRWPGRHAIIVAYLKVAAPYAALISSVIVAILNR